MLELSPLFIIAIVIAVWLITTKQTRKSVGNSVVEVAMFAEQSLKITRATAFNEALTELGDLNAMLSKSDAFLAGTEPKPTRGAK